MRNFPRLVCLEDLVLRERRAPLLRPAIGLINQYSRAYELTPRARAHLFSMATRRQKIHGIVHLASASCAAVGAGLAQLPGSDSATIVPIQTAMIVSIAHQHEVQIGKAVAIELLVGFAATTSGRFVSQLLVGWIPGFGNAINASTAAAITETIGWTADRYFAKAAEKNAIQVT